MTGKRRGTIQDRMLAEIADAIIALLIDNSEQGFEKLTQAVANAGKRYNADDWWTSYVLSYFRTRQGVAKNTEQDIVDYPDIVTRLQTLAKVFLDSNGGWESTSYNTSLLINFLGALDNHPNPSEEKFYLDNVQALSTPFKQKLQEALHEHLFQQKITQEETRALRTISDQAKKETLKFVYLFSDSSLAKQHAIEHPKHVVFHLDLDGDAELSSFDLFGDVNKIEIRPALKQLLSKGQTNLFENETVKYECLKARDQFNNQRKLLINPRASELNDLSNIFILRQGNHEPSLDWYDALGACRAIDIKQYPAMADFIASRTHFDEDASRQLMRHLRRINTISVAGIQRTKQTLEKFFQAKLSPVSVSFNVLVNPLAHELNGLASSFVLTNEPDNLSLVWYDALGVGREISLTAYESLAAWVKRQDDIAEEDLPELKRLLSEVDTSQSINRDTFKAELEACLTRGGRALQLSEKPQQDVKPLEESLAFDLSEFKQTLARALGGRDIPLPPQPPKEKAAERGKLNLANYAGVTGLFGHQEKASVSDEDVDQSTAPQLS